MEFGVKIDWKQKGCHEANLKVAKKERAGWQEYRDRESRNQSRRGWQKGKAWETWREGGRWKEKGRGEEIRKEGACSSGAEEQRKALQLSHMDETSTTIRDSVNHNHSPTHLSVDWEYVHKHTHTHTHNYYMQISGRRGKRKEITVATVTAQKHLFHFLSLSLCVCVCVCVCLCLCWTVPVFGTSRTWVWHACMHTYTHLVWRDFKLLSHCFRALYICRLDSNPIVF